MLVVLVRRGATREAYADPDRGAMPDATELNLRLSLLRLPGFDEDGSGAGRGEAVGVRGDVVDGVGRDLAGVEDDV